MPESDNTAMLSAEHLKYWKEQYSELTLEQFTEYVCNAGAVLPVNKLGPSDHIPCTWLGQTRVPRDFALHEDFLREQRRANGWRRTRYLLILPNPDECDTEHRTALYPGSRRGELVRRELKEAGIPLTECVATHVCRFPLPRTMKKYSQRHKKDGHAYIQADIEQCKPDVIITFGADALKSLFGKNAKLDTYQGNTLEYTTASGHTAKVVPTYSHLAFLAGYAEISVFRAELRKAMEIGEGLFSRQSVKKDYYVCQTADDVENLCDRIRQIAPPWISFDTEFGNSVAREEFTKTISIQLGWGVGSAAFIPLTRQVEVFKPEPDCQSFEAWAEANYKDPWTLFAAKESSAERARKRYNTYVEKAKKAVPWRKFKEYHFEHGGRFFTAGHDLHTPEDAHRIWSAVQELLLDRRWRICAHHLRTDCYQFERNGYPITDRIEDGIDTMLLHHLLYGDESQGLDHVVRKYLPHYGAFWQELEEYLDATGSRKKHLDFGYRDIPFDILVPYALCDADTTWQAAAELLREVKAHPRLRTLYAQHVNATSWHIYQMERAGILVDDEKRAEMFDIYEPVYNTLLERLREEINWPGFNPGSDDQLKTLLFFGCRYKDPKPPPTFEQGRPRLLQLTPVFNTDKYPKDWETICAEREEEYNTPSVGAAALDLLYHQYREVPGCEQTARTLKTLKHLSVVGKFLSTYLAPRQVNEYGVIEDGKGFHNNIWNDGRVRTRLSQLTATGRYTSSKANLQTKPKKQEAAAKEALVDFHYGVSVKEYERRSDDAYEGDDKLEKLNIPKFASCFIARPGYCLIEADFATAEVYVWAYASGDLALIKLVDSGRDAHSENTLRSFSLPELPLLEPALAKLEEGDRADYEALCETVKKKYGALRIAAKSVLFGIMYGRGAIALAREINKVVDDPVSVADTQKVIDGIAESFPVAWQWLVDNSESAVRNEYVENAFGRRRYFQGAREMSDTDQAAVRREAKNSPIQGTVADLLAQAGYNLHRILRKLRREGRAPDIEILLPIHDAFLFEVKCEDVPKVIPLIEVCMSKRNMLPGTEYHLGVDIEIFPHSWADKAYDPHKPGQLEEYMETYAEAA